MSENSKQLGSKGLALSVAVAVLFASAPLLAQQLRPRLHTAVANGPIDLQKQIPSTFGDWQEDASTTPLLPSPEMQAALSATYNQVLARTYINHAGQRVMLSIGYGNDQNNEATAVHRPEFCYRAQGFQVQALEKTKISVHGIDLPVARLLATRGPRQELISYWVTLDKSTALPGMSRKLQQLRYGFRGEIADGMIIRVSTLKNENNAGFDLQAKFLNDLNQNIAAPLQARYFGEKRS